MEHVLSALPVGTGEEGGLVSRWERVIGGPECYLTVIQKVMGISDGFGAQVRSVQGTDLGIFLCRM